MRQMKDSGIEWIGEIPAEWEVKRVKSLFAERNERCESETELPLLSVSEYYGVAQRKEKIKEDETLVRAETLEGYKICHKHDIVSNIMLAWRSSLGESPCDGIVSPAYCVYKPIADICTRFYHYLFRTNIYANVFKQYSTGIIDSRLRLYSDKFFSLFVQAPPLPEQQRIADYLDALCARIDNTMELVRQSKETLRAYKLSLITEAVTKGLDPHVPMKDSGIPWIGEIPAGWEVRRLKNICTLSPKIGYSHLSPGDEVTFLPMENIKNGFFCNSKKPFSKELATYNIFENGNILLAKVTPCFENGNIAIAEHLESNIGFGTSEIFVIKVFSHNIKFMFYFFQNHIFKLRAISTMTGTGGLKRVSPNFMKTEKIPLPPLPEQERIAAYLDEKCARVDALLAEKDELLDKLAAYRKSLIYECVTGKREVAA